MTSPAEIPAIASLFPQGPEYIAHWAPIFMEPMQGSGERFTIGIVAIDSEGNAAVEPVIADRTLHCMFGDAAKKFSSAVALIVESLQEHLHAGYEVGKWLSPLRDATFLGPLRPALGDSLQDILRSGAQLTASLSGAYLSAEVFEVIAEKQSGEGDEWVRQIKEQTVAMRLEFGARFQKELPIRVGAPPTRFGSVGDRLAAQFGRLIPGRGLTKHRNRAKAYLTDLQILRDHYDANDLLRRPYYELMLWVPPRSSPAYTQSQMDDAEGSLVELEEFGNKHDLRVAAMLDSQEAAKRIVEAEAA